MNSFFLIIGSDPTFKNLPLESSLERSGQPVEARSCECHITPNEQHNAVLSDTTWC